MSDQSASVSTHWVPHQPAERILMTLKTRGPQGIATIAEVLDVTAEAVRQQMARLQVEGLVDAETRSAGRGRPTQIWRLTQAGHARFPDMHAEMTVQMLGAVRQVFGESGIDKLIGAREASMRASYAEAMQGADGLRERLERLVAVRSREGYMAELVATDDGYLLVENHCPICAAAQACMAFCRSELDLFREIIGPQARVERAEHILAGARRCAYTVRPLRQAA